ncbi:MAG TPA: glycosyltransferase family 2 protein [Candidatus Acidoferrales bacterium]|nr:glycosyltransferase family 2 protein [Candidatus Acidoferrales bacterium]
MHILAITFFSALALLWIFSTVTTYRGMASIPSLTAIAPFGGPEFPRISILLAARDEAEKLPAALASLLALNYPNYEVIAVDDRSTDATGKILDDFAARDARLKVIHVSELPQGWLGKPHALEAAYKKSSGEWLIFTDADVHFAPDLLRRALAFVQQEQAEHLTLLARLDLRGFWEPVALGYLGVAFALGARPWKTNDPKSKAYMGVGAFQMIRRTTYEAIGTHRRLAMEVVDDMKLGKLVKMGGFRSTAAPSEHLLRVRWQEGFGNIVKGLTKNMFAGFSFSGAQAIAAACVIFAVSVAPVLGMIFARGAAQIAAGVAMIAAMVFEALLMPRARASRIFGVTHALGATVIMYIIVRSMVVTLGRGGVVWRGTFYPLEDLKRGQV